MHMAADEEYELMPLTPLRRLEKEVQSIKELRSPTIDRDVIHELIESNLTTQRKLNKMLDSLEVLNTNFNEFLSLFKYASTEVKTKAKKSSSPSVSAGPGSMDTLVSQNERLIRSMEDLSKHIKKQVYETKYKPALAKKLSPGKPISYSRHR